MYYPFLPMGFNPVRPPVQVAQPPVTTVTGMQPKPAHPASSAAAVAPPLAPYAVVQGAAFGGAPAPFSTDPLAPDPRVLSPYAVAMQEPARRPGGYAGSWPQPGTPWPGALRPPITSFNPHLGG